MLLCANVAVIRDRQNSFPCHHWVLIRLEIIFVKLLNIQAVLRDNPLIILIFILHATEQANGKSALTIRESSLELHSSRN